jgi:hypothetical protein
VSVRLAGKDESEGWWWCVWPGLELGHSEDNNRQYGVSTAIEPRSTIPVLHRKSIMCFEVLGILKRSALVTGVIEHYDAHNS